MAKLTIKAWAIKVTPVSPSAKPDFLADEFGLPRLFKTNEDAQRVSFGIGVKPEIIQVEVREL